MADRTQSQRLPNLPVTAKQDTTIRRINVLSNPQTQKGGSGSSLGAGSVYSGGSGSGTPGPAGASAYEVAVANGFVGTEADWLASLVGPAGANGANGTNGTNGVGVPTGGSSGQVLTKSSATDYDTEWQDPPATGSSVYYGNETATISGATNTITLGSMPLANSPLVFLDNGSLLSYTAVDNVLTIATQYSGTIRVWWATANNVPGGITLSVVGAAAPSVRGTGMQSSSGSTFNIAWPVGTQAGDLAVIFGGHGYGINTPSGWTAGFNQGGTNFSGMSAYKILTAGDIATGYVTVTTLGSYNGVFGICTLVGNTAGVRETAAQRNGGGSASVTQATSTSVVTSDLLIYFGSNRAASVDTVNRGTLRQQVNATEASGCLYTEVAPSNGAQSANFLYGTIGVGNFEAIVVVKGV